MIIWTNSSFNKQQHLFQFVHFQFSKTWEMKTLHLNNPSRHLELKHSGRVPVWFPELFLRNKSISFSSGMVMWLLLIVFIQLLHQCLPSTHYVSLGWVLRMQRWTGTAPQIDYSNRVIVLWCGPDSSERIDLSPSLAGQKSHLNWDPKDALRWKRWNTRF